MTAAQLIMDLQSALIAAVGGLTAAIGVMWMALQKEIQRAREDCAEDRRKLWDLITVVKQLERRKDSLPSSDGN